MTTSHKMQVKQIMGEMLTLYWKYLDLRYRLEDITVAEEDALEDTPISKRFGEEYGNAEEYVARLHDAEEAVDEAERKLKKAIDYIEQIPEDV